MTQDNRHLPRINSVRYNHDIDPLGLPQFGWLILLRQLYEPIRRHKIYSVRFIQLFFQL